MLQSLISRYPGARLDGYRNSMPRTVKLIAIGPGAERLVAEMIDGNQDNVLIADGIDLDHCVPLDEPVNGHRPHAVILVHEDGEVGRFPFLIERTASMLSLVVLEDRAPGRQNAQSGRVRDLRAIADLFVTTSDRDFVRELVDNLAS